MKKYMFEGKVKKNQRFLLRSDTTLDEYSITWNGEMRLIPTEVVRATFDSLAQIETSLNLDEYDKITITFNNEKIYSTEG